MTPTSRGRKAEMEGASSAEQRKPTHSPSLISIDTFAFPGMNSVLDGTTFFRHSALRRQPQSEKSPSLTYQPFFSFCPGFSQHSYRKSAKEDTSSHLTSQGNTDLLQKSSTSTSPSQHSHMLLLLEVLLPALEDLLLMAKMATIFRPTN